MGSPNGSNDTTHTPPPLSFYNTFKAYLSNDSLILSVAAYEKSTFRFFYWNKRLYG
jgi:hypothetical protein